MDYLYLLIIRECHSSPYVALSGASELLHNIYFIIHTLIQRRYKTTANNFNNSYTPTLLTQRKGSSADTENSTNSQYNIYEEIYIYIYIVM